MSNEACAAQNLTAHKQERLLCEYLAGLADDLRKKALDVLPYAGPRLRSV